MGEGETARRVPLGAKRAEDLRASIGCRVISQLRLHRLVVLTLIVNSISFRRVQELTKKYRATLFSHA